MLKRRFANSVEGDFSSKYIDDDFLKGYVCCNKLRCDRPLIVYNGAENVRIKDNDFTWLLVYPDNSNYAITIIFDDKMNLVEWYFDISKKIGVENDVPYEDDLFLDMVINPTGQVLIIDEDELLDAKMKGIVTDEDVELAYSTLNHLKDLYGQNLQYLKSLTKHLCELFDLKFRFK